MVKYPENCLQQAPSEHSESTEEIEEGDNRLHRSIHIIQYRDRRKNRMEEEQEGMGHLEL